MLPPSDFKTTVSGTTPKEVCDAVHGFLVKEFPADISTRPLCDEQKQGFQVSATVFVDFIPVRVEVYAMPDGAFDVALSFNHPSQKDIVRFNCLVEHSIAFLQSQGMQIGTSKKMGLNQLIDDVPEDQELSWKERVEVVQDNMASDCAMLREESLQYLARWADLSPACHTAVANVFVKSKFEERLLAAASTPLPLAELYPAISALHSVSCATSPEACDILCSAPICAALKTLTSSELPPIVASKLAVAVQSLQLWNAFSPKLSDEKITRDMGSNSTRCTDLDTLHDFGDLDDVDDVEDEQEMLAM
jgi:hypothetical protein